MLVIKIAILATLAFATFKFSGDIQPDGGTGTCQQDCMNDPGVCADAPSKPACCKAECGGLITPQ